MKLNKIIALSILVLSFIYVKAQTNDNEVISKKTVDYLPKAGEFGIGVDATPIFNYMGNLFNATSGNKLDFSSPVLYGKYYLSNETALRAVLSIQSINHKDMFYVRDDAAFFLDPLANKKVTDSKNASNQQYFVSLAYQKYIGVSRLRGFYGGQVLFGYNYSNTTNTYGNPMSEVNPTPSSIYPYTNDKTRLLQNVDVNSYHVGVGAIAGFEYYVLPKLCIGGELSLNLVYTKGSQLTNKTEQVVGNAVVTSDQTVSPGSSDFSIKTSRFTPNGFEEQLGFYVMFHF